MSEPVQELVRDHRELRDLIRGQVPGEVSSQVEGQLQVDVWVQVWGRLLLPSWGQVSEESAVAQYSGSSGVVEDAQSALLREE